jgi:surfactin synthase thioesterase subunit
MLTKLSSGVDGAWCAIPGVAGFSTAFSKIAKEFQERGHALNAFEATRYLASRSNALDVTAIAQGFIDTVAQENVRLKGVMGHSFGGRIAFEVALTLESTMPGLPLVLLDAVPAGYVAHGKESVDRRSDLSLLRWLIDSMPAIASRVGSFESAEVAMARLVKLRVFRESELRQLLETIRCQVGLHAMYRPARKLSADTCVVLICGRSSGLGCLDEETLGTVMSACCGRYELVRVDGDHMSMLHAAKDIFEASQVNAYLPR